MHLNSGFISLFSLSNIGLISCFILSISHSMSSISLFLFTGLIINKSKSRYIESINFLCFTLRILLLLIILSNLSFPGSINFISELSTLIALYSIDYLLLLIILFISLLSTILWIQLINIKLAFNYCFNLISINYIIIYYLLFINYYLGFYIIFTIHYSLLMNN